MPASNTENSLTLEKIYTELRAGVRETDNISFRLLGLVPLVSGATLIGLILKEGTPGPVVSLLSLFAAGVTLGIFRWELRNAQNCKWLIQYADCLERHALRGYDVAGVNRTLPRAPQGIGKTYGEMVIYVSTILAWLGLPLMSRAVAWPPRAEGDVFYVVLATAILSFTFLSLFAKTDVDETCDRDQQDK